ncbi:MAG: bifunctional hydroxymethylpyrimidine kinase/phosphomethylpyrimidine kinase [Nocardioidaceae bacterium]
MRPDPVMLTLAGSDPSGGAGMQADLKTASAFGVYGASVITALTAQNTTGVSGIHTPPTEFLRAQFESVASDLDVRAIKIGMLGSAALVETVHDLLERWPVPAVVLDPVLVATSGDLLVPHDAAQAIRRLLVPLASVVTPNVPEAEALTGLAVTDVAAMARAGHALRDCGAGASLVTGGHLTGAQSVDVIVDGEGVDQLSAPRIDTPNTHGTGDTLSSAIAAGLALDIPIRRAMADAKEFVFRALRAGRQHRLGAGHGPIDHLVSWPPDDFR